MAYKDMLRKEVELSLLKGKGILSEEEYRACVQAIKDLREKATCEIHSGEKEPELIFSALGLEVSLISISYAKRFKNTLELEFLLVNNSEYDIEDIELAEFSINDYIYEDGLMELAQIVPPHKKKREQYFILEIAKYGGFNMNEGDKLEFKIQFEINGERKISTYSYTIEYMLNSEYVIY